MTRGHAQDRCPTLLKSVPSVLSVVLGLAHLTGRGAIVPPRPRELRSARPSWGEILPLRGRFSGPLSCFRVLRAAGRRSGSSHARSDTARSQEVDSQVFMQKPLASAVFSPARLWIEAPIGILRCFEERVPDGGRNCAARRLGRNSQAPGAERTGLVKRFQLAAGFP